MHQVEKALQDGRPALDVAKELVNPSASPSCPKNSRGKIVGRLVLEALDRIVKIRIQSTHCRGDFSSLVVREEVAVELSLLCDASKQVESDAAELAVEMGSGIFRRIFEVVDELVELLCRSYTRVDPAQDIAHVETAQDISTAASDNSVLGTCRRWDGEKGCWISDSTCVDDGT